MSRSACYGRQDDRQLVVASSPAADSPAPASVPAGRSASRLEVLVVSAPALEGSTAVHDHGDVLRLDPARSGDLSSLLLCWRCDVIASALAARLERVSLVHDGVDDGVVAAVQGVHRILAPERVAGSIAEGNTETWVDNFKTQVVCKEKILEVAAHLHEALPEAGLKTFITPVGGMVICTAAALLKVAGQRCEEDDQQALQQS